MKKKYYIILGIVLLFLLGLVILYFGYNYEGPSSDVLAFKKEYESLNGKDNYQTLIIDKKSKIEYVSVNDFYKLFKTGSELVFIGKPDDAKTRSIVEDLLEVVNCSCLDKLLYINYNDILESNNYELLKSELDEFNIPLIIGFNRGVIGTIHNSESLKDDVDSLINLVTKNDEPAVCDDAC